MASPFVPPLDSTPGASPNSPLPAVIPSSPNHGGPSWAHTPHTPASYPAMAAYPPAYPPSGGYPPYPYAQATPYAPATPYSGYAQPPPPPPQPPRGGWNAGGWSADPGPNRPPGVSEDYVGYPPQSFTSPWAAPPVLPAGGPPPHAQWGAPPPPAPPPPPAGPYGYRAHPTNYPGAHTPYAAPWGATPAAPYAAFPPDPYGRPPPDPYARDPYARDPYGGPPPGTPWSGGPPVVPIGAMPPPPGPPVPRGHSGDRMDKFAPGPHYGPVLTPLLLRVTGAPLELHPLLQPPPDDPDARPHLRWNMTFPTSHCQRSTDRANESWMKGRGDPATWPRVTEMRLVPVVPAQRDAGGSVQPERPLWSITLKAQDEALGITCGEVIEAIKEDMYRYTARTDYESAPRATRHDVGRAYAANRARAPGVVGGALGEGMRRFDFLGGWRMFGGLEGEEASTGLKRTAGLPAVLILRCAQPLRAEVEATEAVARRIEEEATRRMEEETRIRRAEEERLDAEGRMDEEEEERRLEEEERRLEEEERRLEEEERERLERLERIRASRLAEGGGGGGSNAGSRAGSRATSRVGDSRAGSRAGASRAGDPRAGSRAGASRAGDPRAGSRDPRSSSRALGTHTPGSRMGGVPAVSRTGSGASSSRRLASVTSTSDEETSSSE